MTKQELRKLIRERKRQHTKEELSVYSQSICHSVLERIRHEKHCQTILLYHSLPDEVDTHNLIRLLHAEGKKVLLPTVIGNDLELHVYEGEQALDIGTSYGIQESTGTLFADFAHIDLAFIPGMAFTKQGNRLGRGKGYYDRLLPQLSCPLIGIAFPFQLLPAIPNEPHDIPMKEVISE